MNYDKAILIENFDYVSPIHVCVTLICDVLLTQLYNHHTYDVSQRLYITSKRIKLESPDWSGFVAN